MQSAKRILIVEDDLNLTLALYRALSHTYKVVTARTAASALKKVQLMSPNLIMLDLHLPDQHGLDFTQELRRIGVHTPILVLSGESSLISKVDLLDSGANDYVTKPFSLAELKARIRVLLRAQHLPIRRPITSNGLTLNPNLREVNKDDESFHLPKKEYLLLECLMSNAGIAVSREFLMNYVWGHTVKDNSLDVQIKTLRDRLETTCGRDFIATVPGVGYVFHAAIEVTI
jgi:two-component system response regulator MprA